MVVGVGERDMLSQPAHQDFSTGKTSNLNIDRCLYNFKGTLFKQRRLGLVQFHSRRCRLLEFMNEATNSALPYSVDIV